MLFKIVVLKILQFSQENTCIGVSFFSFLPDTKSLIINKIKLHKFWFGEEIAITSFAENGELREPHHGNSFKINKYINLKTVKFMLNSVWCQNLLKNFASNIIIKSDAMRYYYKLVLLSLLQSDVICYDIVV